MVSINLGDILSKDTIKTGEKDGKKWMLCYKTDENGKDRITVFAANIGAVNPEYDQKITKILETKFYWKKFNDKFYPQIAINAELLSAIPTAAPESSFIPLEDDDIPF